MQAILIIILYIITAGFAYSVYKDIKRPPETARPEPEPENRPPGPQKQNRRQIAHHGHGHIGAVARVF